MEGAELKLENKGNCLFCKVPSVKEHPIRTLLQYLQMRKVEVEVKVEPGERERANFITVDLDGPEVKAGLCEECGDHLETFLKAKEELEMTVRACLASIQSKMEVGSEKNDMTTEYPIQEGTIVKEALRRLKKTQPRVVPENLQLPEVCDDSPAVVKIEEEEEEVGTTEDLSSIGDFEKDKDGHEQMETTEDVPIILSVRSIQPEEDELGEIDNDDSNSNNLVDAKDPSLPPANPVYDVEINEQGDVSLHPDAGPGVQLFEYDGAEAPASPQPSTSRDHQGTGSPLQGTSSPTANPAQQPEPVPQMRIEPATQAERRSAFLTMNAARNVFEIELQTVMRDMLLETAPVTFGQLMNRVLNNVTVSMSPDNLENTCMEAMLSSTKAPGPGALRDLNEGLKLIGPIEGPRRYRGDAEKKKQEAERRKEAKTNPNEEVTPKEAALYCALCKQFFSRSDKIREHFEKKAHLLTGLGYRCPMLDCNVTRSNRCDMKTHLVAIHELDEMEVAACIGNLRQREMIFYNAAQDETPDANESRAASPTVPRGDDYPGRNPLSPPPPPPAAESVACN